MDDVYFRSYGLVGTLRVRWRSACALGVLGEVLAGWQEPEWKKLERTSSVVLILGLALSLSALIGTNEHFNGTIADLNLKSSQANERAAKSEADAGDANQRAATLQKEAEDEAIARVQMEQVLSATGLLTTSQMNNAVTLLAEFKGERFFIIKENTASRALEAQLTIIMDRAGWSLNIEQPQPESSCAEILPLLNSVTVQSTADPRSMAASRQLARILAKTVITTVSDKRLCVRHPFVVVYIPRMTLPPIEPPTPTMR